MDLRTFSLKSRLDKMFALRDIYRPEVTMEGVSGINACCLEDSTYLAVPNGLERVVVCTEAVADFGDDKGDGTVEGAVERGSSSNFLRTIDGVGGADVVAVSASSAKL